MTSHNPDTREKLLELAERCEKATGPDRELDAMIHARDGLEGVGYWSDAPAFTASLDAAMTLVPEGWTYRLSSAPHRKGHAADLWPPIEPGKGPFVRRADAPIVRRGGAPTPSLALCAAALRAQNEQVAK